ncbi:MAG: 30S ribosomal protein S14, partial [Alphaproteobacteria bacterium]
IERNKKRAAMARKTAARRARLKAMAKDASLSPEEQFQARLKLAEMPRNGNPTRVRNRCQVSGRPRAYYRRFKMSRIALRELASAGQIPGVVKSSW